MAARPVRGTGRRTHPPQGGQGASVRSHDARNKLDECRRRVQNETMAIAVTRTTRSNRARRLLTKAHENLDQAGEAKLLA